MELRDTLRLLLNFFELLACISGFIFWTKQKKSYWKYFTIYLSVIASVELLGWFFRSVKKLAIYNVYLYQYFGIPLQFLFFYWLFYKYFSVRWQKNIALLSSITFIICWLIQILSNQTTVYWFISLSSDIGTIFLLILILIFIFHLILTDEILKFKTNIMFWVVMGLFSGYIFTVPYYIWRDYLLHFYKTNPELINTAFYGFLFLNYLMYFLFSVGFVKWKPATA